MANKKMAILGGGHGAHTLAADMKNRGHEVRLFEMPEFKKNVQKLFETKTIEVTGVAKYKAVLDMVTDDIEQAVNGAEYVFVVTPAFAHQAYAKLLKGRVRSDQNLVIFPGGFGALIFKKEFGQGDCPVIAESNTLPYDTRLSEPCKIQLFGYNNLRLGFMPSERSAELNKKFREDLFDFGAPYTDVLECSLSNANPCLHTGPCLLSVSSIENPTINFFLYEHGFTPSAAKLNMALDNERKAVGRALGYKITCMEDFSGLPENFTWQQFYMSAHGQIALTPISGPNDIFNRYLTEDVFCALAPWTGLGRQLGVDMPCMEAAVNIYSVIHETNWREKAYQVADLGLDGLSVEQIRAYAQTGRKG